jgi:hypothetical protein
MKETIFYLEGRGGRWIYHFFLYNLSGLYYILNENYNHRGRPNTSVLLDDTSKIVDKPTCKELIFPIKIYMKDVIQFQKETFEIIKDKFELIEDLTQFNNNYEIIKFGNSNENYQILYFKLNIELLINDTDDHIIVNHAIKSYLDLIYKESSLKTGILQVFKQEIVQSSTKKSSTKKSQTNIKELQLEYYNATKNIFNASRLLKLLDKTNTVLKVEEEAAEEENFILKKQNNNEKNTIIQELDHIYKYVKMCL